MGRPSIEAMKKSGLSLALFACISAIFVVGTHFLVKDRVAKNDEMLLLRTINQILPPERYDNNLVETEFLLEKKQSGLENDAIVFLAKKDNKAVATIFEITTLRGYGVITLLIGINAKDQTLAGVRVVRHTETPGLGDKIEIKKSDWILAFDGKSLNNPAPSGWFVKKDGGEFDQFTGATITPRAIVNTTKSVLLYAQDHLDKLNQQIIAYQSHKTQKQTNKQKAKEGNH